LVAGRSPRRGGRERSERWKGESAAFSLQRDDVGSERADDPKLELSLPWDQTLPAVGHPLDDIIEDDEDDKEDEDHEPYLHPDLPDLGAEIAP